MKKLRFLAPLALAPLLWTSATAAASPSTVVERIVGVVGDHAILYSEMRARAIPELVRLARTGRSADAQSTERTKIYKRIVERMIDEKLDERAAEKAKLPPITSTEVDKALVVLANQRKMTVPQFISAARQDGYTEQSFRDEVRRQIQSDALLQHHVLPRVRVTEQDARSVYQRERAKMGDDFPVRVSMIWLLPRDQKPRIDLAKDLAKRANQGEDFCGLVTKYSDAAESHQVCGFSAPPASKAPELVAAVKNLRPGQVAEPIVTPEGYVIVVKLMGPLRAPTYEELRDGLMFRAREEAVERQKRLWLGELRRGVYWDIRVL